MGKQLIFHPGAFGLDGAQATTTAWVTNAVLTITAASGSGGVAIPFLCDGTAIKSVKFRIGAGSQAGTLHAEFQKPSTAPDVNNVSGLPDGTAITNGVAGAASITGAVVEVVELTWATAPTPTGLHWLVLEGSSVGTIDIEISYVLDYGHTTSSSYSMVETAYHDGVDWNNYVGIKTSAAVLLDGSGNALPFSSFKYPPFFDTGADMTVIVTADNKEVVGFEFTAKDNLTELRGIRWAWDGLGADMNYQMILAKDDGTIIKSSSVFNQQPEANAGDVRLFQFDNPATIVSGSTYRAFLFNPEDTVDDIGIHYWDLAAASDQTKYFGMDSGEFALAQATDPPEAGFGGVGAWTITDTKMVWAQLVFESDISAISGGGGGQYSWA